MKTQDAFEAPAAIVRLKKDLKAAALNLADREARFLVDQYYMIQEARKRGANQERALGKTEEPNLVLNWVRGTMETMEAEIKKALTYYLTVEQSGMGRWACDVVGVGPILSAGLLAHIDITKVQTVGGIWRFAGLDPTAKWAKGSKRPWNAALKVICWKIGQSFEKVSNNPDSQYGELYKKRKAYEWERNLSGELAEQAKQGAARVGAATKSHIWYAGKVSPSYVRGVLNELEQQDDDDEGGAPELGAIKPTQVGDEQPMLNPGHIRSRALRWTVKLFLSHWFEEAYRRQYKKEPPEIYSIAMLKHAHKIEPRSQSR